MAIVRSRPPVVSSRSVSTVTSPVRLEPFPGRSRTSPLAAWLALLLPVLLVLAPVGARAEIGGSDVLVSAARTGEVDLEILPDGTAFAAVEEGVYPNYDVVVYRSTDGGTTWEEWSRRGTVAGTAYADPDLHFVEGSPDRLLLGCVFRQLSGSIVTLEAVLVGRADPAAATAGWDDWTVALAGDAVFTDPSLTSDEAFHSAYNVYVAYARNETDGADIWAARSTNEADSFSSPVVVAEASSVSFDFRAPDLAYGAGDRLLLVHQRRNRTDAGETPEAAIQLRRSLDRGASWLALGTPVTSSLDGIVQVGPSVAAHPTTDEVVVGWRWAVGTTNGAEIGWSTDGGASFLAGNRVSFDDMRIFDLERGPFAELVVSAREDVDGRFGLLEPAASALDGSWSFEPMHDDISTSGGSGLAHDPTRGRWAIAGATTFYDDSEGVFLDRMEAVFDAEWRADSGYPVHESASPLDWKARTAPLLADLDGDFDEELVAVDFDARLHVLADDLSDAPGWPVDFGWAADWSVPVAADLDDDGEMEILVADADGVIHGYTRHGQVLLDWPVDLGSNLGVYVSAGTVSRRSPMDVVVGTASEVWLLRPDGTIRQESPFALDPAYGWVISPVAVADLDGDDRDELVVSQFWRVTVLDDDGSFLNEVWSDPQGPVRVGPGGVSLGDLDVDGDLEVVIPLSDGTVEARHHDGTNLGPAWPFAEPSGTAISEVAIASVWSLNAPELAFTAQQGAAWLVQADGQIPAGWPHAPAGQSWSPSAGPVIDAVDTDSRSSVLISGWDERVHARTTFLGPIDGWPLVESVNGEAVTPVTGDVDGDARQEVVVNTVRGLGVFDLGVGEQGVQSRRWPMAFHDARRSSCACNATERVTAVDPTASSRVRFALDSANPADGAASFTWNLPSRATVRLEVFDLRGRRVAGVVDRTMGAGTHWVRWDGRDEGGHPVAAGSYFARLRVDGPAGETARTRKLTVVR